MKRIFQLLAFSFLLVACESESDYKIVGTTPDINNGTAVYLQEIDQNNRLANLDTAVVKEGKFSFDPANVETPKMAVLSFEGLNGNVILIAENEKIEVTAYKDSLFSSEVKGGPENQFFRVYYDDVIGSNLEKQELNKEGIAAMRSADTAKVDVIRNELKDIEAADTRRRIKLIEENPNKFVSLIIYADLIGMRLIDAAKAEELFQSLSQELRESERGQQLKEMTAKLKEQEIASQQAEVGNKAPAFSAPTPSGEQLALSDAMGKYTIIDFWASWCKPCREENPNVVNVYKKYHDKGLNIISVSLDREDAREKWLTAIENDQMDWYHVSNLMEWQDPVARKYGVTAIPATYLLDENGVIIEKNLRGEELVNKMQELFGKS